MTGLTAQFCDEYAKHRAAEGRELSLEVLRTLPYIKIGPLAPQWAVRACTFDAFVRHVLQPPHRPLSLLDLGAGNGWLCYRAASMGHQAVALDVRDDTIDGLGAARRFLIDQPHLFKCVLASFDDIPLESGQFDVTLFNAALHYAQDLKLTLAEAIRVTRRGGVLAILDSPFYRSDADGAAMVAEKLAYGAARFGPGADLLLAQNFIEYLTTERLAAAAPHLTWVRRRVWYPLWYELRPLISYLRRTRVPSRFDIWTACVS